MHFTRLKLKNWRNFVQCGSGVYSGPCAEDGDAMRRIRSKAARWFKKSFRGAGRVNAFGMGTIRLIDVGSAGELPEPWFSHAPTIRSLVRFEPREDGEPDPDDVLSLPYALAERDGPKEFHVYAGMGGSGSSLFRQNVEYVRANWDRLRDRGPSQLAKTWFERSALVRSGQIPCRSLDSVLAEVRSRGQARERYPFLKIDAQGAESLILEGASRYLGEECQGLHLELFTVPLYEGIALLPEVESFLTKRGFELVKKYPPHGSFDSQHDCVFLRKSLGGRDREEIERVYGI